VNPPLASTAIGVVPPHQAGMASGVNSTFRQVGIATGIAALGTIFTNAIERHLSTTLPASLAGSESRIVSAIRQGNVGHLISSVPPSDRAAIDAALRSSFAAGMNDLLYVTAALALAGGVCAAVLIRRKDFHQPGAAAEVADAATGQSATETVS